MRYSVVAVAAGIGLAGFFARPAESQPQAKALVQLQATTPGTPQAGHVHVGGAGLFGTRIGIGTTNPNDPLSLSATGYGFVHSSGATQLGTYVDGQGGWLGTRSAHPLFLFTGNGSARLTVAASGDVGIGTTTPGALLHVAGTTRTDGLTMPTGAAAGRVLTSDASGNASWQTVSGGFSLPYTGSATTGADVLGITNNNGNWWSTAIKGTSTGTGIGVYGSTNAGYGVFADSTHPSAVTAAVWAQSASTSGRGVVGYVPAVSGVNYGVVGQSDSTAGAGVYGYVGSGTGSSGVLGQSAGINGVGVRGLATQGNASAGVWGESPVGRGVFGYHPTLSGIGEAMYGYTEASSGTGAVGHAPGPFFTYGVHGWATGGNSAYGVFATGRMASSGTKSFRIDHPLDPENKYLIHYCTEGEEPLNVYRGNITLDASGTAIVRLPEYYDEINRDASYQLTAIGRPAPNLHVSKEIDGGVFAIAGGHPGQRVSWRVEAVRNDRFVRQFGAPTEVDKPDEFRGKYIHAELYGLPKERNERYSPPPRPTRSDGAPVTR